MNACQVHIDRTPDPIVQVQGELCMATVPELEAGVLDLVGSRPGAPLTVDLRDVAFCDLTGLRSVWWIDRYCHDRGLTVRILGSDAVARVDRLVGGLLAAHVA